jgi:transmembrane sensor
MLVRAVGTQFDVYRKSEGTVVTVLEGRVAVTTDGLNAVASPNGPSTPVVADFLERITAPDTALLSAGEQVTLTRAVAPKPIRANVSAATAWTQHQLVLESKPLSEVAEEFNRYSARKLMVEESGRHPLRLSGVFSTDPDFLIRYLRDRPDITVRETESEIHISHHD